MAISPQDFPPRRRRLAAGSFISPKLSDQNLIRSLSVLAEEISNLKPLQYVLKKTSSSMIRKSKLLAVLFEELLRNKVSSLSPTGLLCFQEMYIVLQRIRMLIEDCSNGSKMWLLMQNDAVSNSFHELTIDLSTLLDIFPLKEVELHEDVKELVILIRKQTYESKAFNDQRDESLRKQVVKMLDRINREIVPDQSKLEKIFTKLGLKDSSSCSEEIESLEDEVQNQVNDKSKSELVSLIGLVRYGKCVLFGASTPRSGERNRNPRPSSADVIIPVDFRCPITLDLMRDPVVVATGQTYDRASINTWMESGHNTCPKTGQTLVHRDLIPNLALKSLIAMWCKEQRIPFSNPDCRERSNAVLKNKTALEATKMTASFLVNKLRVSAASPEATNRVVYELRVLSKTDSESRACIAEAGAIPLLVKHLGSDHQNLQVNAVTTLLNLSILEANKARIMETDGVLNGVIEVLRSGATWEAKGNAAATIFSLSGVHSYRKKLGRKTRVIKGLMELAKTGPTSSKRDALVAILNLAGDRETVGMLVQDGVTNLVCELMDELPEEAVTILEVVVKKGGAVAVVASHHAIENLVGILRDGSESAREGAAAALVTICRKGGSEMVAELAGTPGIERVIWELMGMGTDRAKRKAASLLRIMRRWTAGLDDVSYSSMSMNTTRTMLTS
ncbi:U-box domain [Dillenia turbinata]|uniref:RING-type E3 ubiquitin transferase n=1 Tax=Dillenia turbinata TaxID=194707 RepID=A0AAN8ZQT7_9MAGN